MPRFSAFNFPYYYPYYRNYNGYRNNYKASPVLINYENEKSSTESTTEKVENENSNRVLSSSCEEPIFEIFGIRLFMDDILILCLLYFLYEEEVKDEMLFIILLLLLIS